MSSYQAAGDYSLSEAIGRRLMTPGGAVAPGIAPEIMPCVVLENDRIATRFLAGEYRYARSVGSIAAGGAATRAQHNLCNVSPNTLVVVERISLGVASTFPTIGIYRGAVGAFPVGTIRRGAPLDSRVGVGARSDAAVSGDNTLGAPTFVAIAQSAATLLTFTDGIVLAPGDYVFMGPSGDNVAINECTVVWSERKLNPSERI